MFSARSFLDARSPATGPSKFEHLEENLKADPDRLRGEFLTIATDPNERWDRRVKSFSILYSQDKALKIQESSETLERLINSFNAEFPANILSALAYESERPDRNNGQAKAFIAFLYCRAFAEFGITAKDYVEKICEALSGTSIEPELKAVLAKVRQVGER